jgi:ferric-dicitrate binding protein FerR (iron transport regulator)
MRDTKAAVHVTPPLTDRRLERQWERISSRLDKGRRLSWPMLSMAAAAVTVVALVFVAKRPAAVAGNAFVVASLPEGKQELAFSDGSRVMVAPGGRLRVDRATAAEVAIHLESGRARFEVKHDPERQFSVKVAEFEVVDRGTRFEVTRGDDARPGVEVRVEEGEVELRDPAHRDPRRLSAGESWSNRAPEPARAVAGSPGEPTSQATTALQPGRAAPTAASGARVAGEEPASEVPVRPSETRSKSAGDAPRAALEPRVARELFETGNLAKLEGRLRDAADAFDTLRLRHRTDGHAALAALELGRLRLNHFGDAAGALGALQDAIKLGPRAPFREEAEARIVDAYATLGRDADCVRAREQFLGRHPRSVHGAAVAGKCGAR